MYNVCLASREQRWLSCNDFGEVLKQSHIVGVSKIFLTQTYFHCRQTLFKRKINFFSTAISKIIILHTLKKDEVFQRTVILIGKCHQLLQLLLLVYILLMITLLCHKLHENIFTRCEIPICHSFKSR